MTRVLTWEGGKQESQREREGDPGSCLAADFEDGGKGHEPRNTGDLRKLEKAMKQISL